MAVPDGHFISFAKSGLFMNKAAQPALLLRDLRFGWSGQPLLNIPRLTVNSGETLFITGPSGCGKSTLLNLITGLLVPDNGDVMVNDQSLSALTSSARDRFRGREMGVISQTLNLLPYLTVEENLQLMQRFAGQKNDSAWQQRLLAQLNLTDQSKQTVSTLSLGQQQRAAIARALVHRPSLIIADEPTSALDDDNKAAFMTLLMDEIQAFDTALVMVSHDRSLDGYFQQIVDLPGLNREAEAC
tara:strand:+ start:130 stop:858 length:729 start_codon:yes stop_codon:yes gene_type:complete